VRVLYVNHIGAVSGAERSLLDLMAAARAQDDVRLACPSGGPLAGAARALGIDVDTIAPTEGSLRLHPAETPRAILRMGAAGWQVARHAWRMPADVIHANSIRAGLFAGPAGRALGIPVVVHVRDRLPRSAVADLSLRLVAAAATTMIANSLYTADGVRAVTAGGRLRVVHNGVDLARFDRARAAPAAARQRLGIDPDAFVMAVVGQITPWKGQREAVAILAALRAAGRDVRLLIVGEPKFVAAATRYDNRAYAAELERDIARGALAGAVSLFGERDDIPQIMSALDALLVPSWEEPFGRVVVEGMSLGLVVVATSIGGPAEIIRDGVDGFLLEPRQPERWVGTLAGLIDAPRRRAELGEAARRRATGYSLDTHLANVRDIYAGAARDV